jgi:hypothetical protein
MHTLSRFVAAFFLGAAQQKFLPLRTAGQNKKEQRLDRPLVSRAVLLPGMSLDVWTTIRDGRSLLPRYWESS